MTGTDNYFAGRMDDPEYAAAYAAYRRELERSDSLIEVFMSGGFHAGEVIEVSDLDDWLYIDTPDGDQAYERAPWAEVDDCPVYVHRPDFE